MLLVSGSYHETITNRCGIYNFNDVFFNVFQVEQDAYIRSQEHVKVLCDDMAAAGVLFTDHDAFGIGNKVYNKLRLNQL